MAIVRTEEAQKAAHRLLPRNSAKAAKARVDRLLNDGIIELATGDALPFSGGALWDETTNRSLARRLHGFTFVADWFGCCDLLDAAELASLKALAIEMVQIWNTRFVVSQEESSMAFHDETTAQRVLALISMMQIFGSDFDEQALELLDKTADLLAQIHFYGGLNNHGMFQDLALLVYTIIFVRPKSEEFFELSLRRLHEYFSACFTDEGVHVENTPTYHAMVSRYLADLTFVLEEQNSKDVEYYEQLLASAQRYATHAITPRGTYPPVSDTTITRLDTGRNFEVFSSPEFKYAATAGKEGVKPEHRIAVFPNSGYAIHRSEWGNEASSFLFFSAAYNNGYHKHSDELSIYLQAHGKEILRESGPFGYDWTNPLTAYGFSSMAHNTLLVDDEGLPRTDKKKDLTTLQDHGVGGEDGLALSVTGKTERFEGVSFERDVKVFETQADSYYQVTDRVASHEGHKYTFLWHVGPGLTPVLHGDYFEIYDGEEKLFEANINANQKFSMRLVYGESDPFVSGWVFPQFRQAEPAHVIVIDVYADNCELSYDFRVQNFKYVPRGIGVSPEWQTYYGQVPVNYILDNPTPNKDHDKLIVVFSAITAPGDFSYNYRRSLQTSKTLKLFIVDDFGDQGAYYYAKNRDLSIFNSVQDLLNRVISENKIDKTAVTFLGSSKGGASALLHGLHLGVGNIVVGAPQTRIGDFTATAHPNILQYIAGDTSPNSVRWLDQAVARELVINRAQSKVTILIGTKDHHFRDHVKPYERIAQKAGNPPHLIELTSLLHADIGRVYSTFIQNWTDVMVDANSGIVHVLYFDRLNQKLRLNLVEAPSGKFSIKFFKGNEPLKTTKYTAETKYSLPIAGPGRYRVRIYWDKEGGERQAFTSEYLIVKKEDF